MKKLLIWLFCAAMLVTATACGDEETGADQPDTSTTASSETESTGTEDATTSATTPEGDSTTSGKKSTGSTEQQPSNNVVNWTDYFGDDTTTTTTKKGETTKETEKQDSTTKETTTTTTKAPTAIDKVTLPAVGTDVDGRGRIAVSEVALSKGVLTLKIRNNTDKQTQKWITEETNYVTYACYDASGKELTSQADGFGYLYIGCLEAGEDVEFQVTLPTGTVKVELTGSKIVYWTPWS